MSIASFMKRHKALPKCPVLPDLYANVWQSIINHLDWPERLGMRAVCTEFHKKQPGLSLATINEMILADLAPLCKSVSRRWDDDECLLSMPRHECLPGCQFHPNKDRNPIPTMVFDHAFVYNPSWDESALLYMDAVKTVRYLIELLRGSFFANVFDDVMPLHARAADLVELLCGNTAIVRAARIAGYLKMSRPMSWESLFE